MTTDYRQVPHDLTAEQAVLGAMILSRQAVADVVEILLAEHFYKPAHGHIFDSILGLYAAGESIDAVSVAADLEAAQMINEIGGPQYLLELQSSTPAISNCVKYARIVEERALMRSLVSAGLEIQDIGYNHGADVPQALDRAESLVLAVADKRQSVEASPLRDLLGPTLDELEQLAENGGQLRGLPTGYLDLDELLLGLQPEGLYVIGARPAMGKSTIGMGIAANAAIRCGKPVLVCSLEMSKLELSKRLLSAEALVDSTRLKTGNLGEAEWNRISQAVGRMAEAELHIFDSPNLTVMEIKAKARRLKARFGEIGVVVVDYIQLMTGRNSAESRQVQVSEISRGLKILARELECPVVALAQLNRSLEQRIDKRPVLSDLRESGSLEQDSDVVLFVYRDEVYDEHSPDKGVAEIIVAKHRNGPIGRVRLAFRGQYTRFDNMARIPHTLKPVQPSSLVGGTMDRVVDDLSYNGGVSLPNGPYHD